MGDKEFFNNLAHKWDQICNHDEEKIRKIIELSNVKAMSKIIDIGTGTGVLIGYLLDTNPLSIKAVDLSENMIKIAKEKFINDRVEFIVKDIMEYSEDGFDYAFIYSAYPHFPHKEKLFSHIRSLINKSGKIIIAHSESKESINSIHSENRATREDRLPPVEVTAKIMEKYFKIDKMIDNEEMYFISGIK